MNFIESFEKKKNELLPFLRGRLESKECAYDFGRVQKLVDSLNDDICFFIEYPYVDSLFRDSFYLYYSTKFYDVDRNVFRIHIFDNSDAQNSILDRKYYGFFIIRSLQRFPLGYSFISPEAFKNNNFVCCLSQRSVSVLGKKYVVNNFPHVVQDTETLSCAESSVWSLLYYFGSKYNEYTPYKISDIIKTLSSFAGHRMLPSKGLTLGELSACLNSCGQNCLVYHISDDSNAIYDYAIMRIYIESGMPFIVVLENEKDGHAVLAIGHENFNQNDLADTFIKRKETWRDVSSFNKRLVFSDDNFPQYQIASCGSPADRYDGNLKKMKIKAYVVPLHKHMYMDAKGAFDIVKITLDDSNFGLHTFGEKWITRLLLTNSSSFKRSLYEDSKIDDKLRYSLQRFHLPKFIWICEIYTVESYKNNICEGLMILDTTGNISLNSVLFYIVKKNVMFSDGLAWIEKNELPFSFQKEVYKNNLKGEWNKWEA